MTINNSHKPAPTIQYAGKTLYYRLTFDDRNFRNWSSEAQSWINHYKYNGKLACCIHYNPFHHLYIEDKIRYVVEIIK